MNLPYHIHTSFIPHADQSNGQAGDYRAIPGTWQCFASVMKDPRHSLLVAFHEIAEMILTQARGVDWKAIDDFDAASGHDDPGSLKDAPYRREHAEAEALERSLAAFLGVDWDDYNKALDAL